VLAVATIVIPGIDSFFDSPSKARRLGVYPYHTVRDAFESFGSIGENAD